MSPISHMKLGCLPETTAVYAKANWKVCFFKKFILVAASMDQCNLKKQKKIWAEHRSTVKSYLISCIFERNLVGLDRALLG